MKSDFGRHIDHTLLRPIGTTTDIRRLCTEAIEYGMAAVCVFPSYVPMAREILKESRVKIATVIAFPFGVTYTEIKEAEMRASAVRGADEMDFVINIAALKSGDDRAIDQEMEYLTSKARTIGVRTKFIIETAYLTDDEKVRVCKVANRVKPDFMKTSTGYGPSGATVEDVRMMRSSLLPEIQIKAAGGIRSYAEALQLLQAGASRLGTRSGIKILEEATTLRSRKPQPSAPTRTYQHRP